MIEKQPFFQVKPWKGAVSSVDHDGYAITIYDRAPTFIWHCISTQNDVKWNDKY